jgi:uncharacterized protein (TIGR01777 family)
VNILVTGATGLIGRALCQRLADEGHTVTILSRHPREDVRFRAFQWDPLGGPPPVDSLEGADAVIHLAGEPVAGGRWTPELKRRIRESRISGTRNLIAGIGAAAVRPKVLVAASAVGFYGDRGDEILDERASPGQGFLSEVCVEWEREANRAGDLGLRVAEVRIGVVLSDAGGALPRMLPAFRLGVAGDLGSGRQWFPWVHIDDVVGIFRHALMTDLVRGPMNAAAPGIVTNSGFTRALAHELHRPSFLSAPAFALRLLFGEMATILLGSQRVIPGVALETGYRFRYPELSEALRDLLTQRRRDAEAQR